MLSDLLNSGLYEVEERIYTSQSNPLEKIRLRYLPVPAKCPRCDSSKIIKKKLSFRTVIDMNGNQPIEVTIIKQRYKCECGKTFTQKDPIDYPDRTRITQDVFNTLGTMILENADLSITQAGEMFGVGRTTASEALHQKLKELSDQIFSTAPCIKISYIPFSFTNKERCAVAGIDQYGRKLLLDILDEYSEERLLKFFPKTDSFKKNIQASFCKLDLSATETIRQHYIHDVGIIHRCISAFMKESCGKIGEPLYAEKYDALAALECAMFLQGNSDFWKIFYDWKFSLSVDLEDALQPFLNTMNQFMQECTVTTSYNQKDTSFKRLMEIITKQRRDRVNFDSMVFRLLYANKTALSTPNGPHIWNSINSMMAPVAGRMTGFGVDIDQLYEETFQL